MTLPYLIWEARLCETTHRLRQFHAHRREMSDPLSLMAGGVAVMATISVALLAGLAVCYQATSALWVYTVLTGLGVVPSAVAGWRVAGPIWKLMVKIRRERQVEAALLERLATAAFRPSRAEIAELPAGRSVTGWRGIPSWWRTSVWSSWDGWLWLTWGIGLMTLLFVVGLLLGSWQAR